MKSVLGRPRGARGAGASSELPPLQREADGARGAFKQPCVQRGFQPGELEGNGGLLPPEPQRRLGELAEGGNGDKGADEIEIERDQWAGHFQHHQMQ